ncbi:MAG: CPBP family intramembrane metalloprotease [Flavobacterium sp.]|nr:MAG: CPBP family intramembrane metalloprotease [Flavobacterium sp.]
MQIAQKNNQSIIIGCILIILLLFLFPFAAASISSLFSLQKTSAAYLSRFTFWLGLLGIWLYALKVENQKLLIWEEKKYNISFYIISIILIFLTLFIGVISIQVLFKLLGLENRSLLLQKMIQFLKHRYLLLFFTALTAGVVEELVFRGYLQPRLTKIFKNPHIAIFISCSLFALMHYKYGTVINVVGPFFIGLVFAYFYWKYQNIKILIFCHFLWDLLLLIMAVARN